MSEPVSLEAGVRQGGILSPLLFSTFIDEILSELSNSKLGCFLHGRCLNSFLYADDLLLLSPTVCDLQLLFDKCSSILDELDLQINHEKSCCLRIGNRCGALCSPIVVNNLTLKWVKEARYLGLTFSSSIKFSCNWQPVKKRLFSSINRILSSLGTNPEVSVVLSLFQSVCTPILIYGLNALSLKTSEINSLTFAFNNLFHKFFKTSNKNTIEQCQYFCGVWPFFALYEFHRFNFLACMFKKITSRNHDLLHQADFDELAAIALKYNFKFQDSINCLKLKVWSFIEKSFI